MDGLKIKVGSLRRGWLGCGGMLLWWGRVGNRSDSEAGGGGTGKGVWGKRFLGQRGGGKEGCVKLGLACDLLGE